MYSVTKKPKMFKSYMNFLNMCLGHFKNKITALALKAALNNIIGKHQGSLFLWSVGHEQATTMLISMSDNE